MSDTSDRRQTRYYLERHAALEFIVALYINMALTVYFFWNYERIPFWGASSIVVDLLSTGVILPLIVGFIAVSRVRKHFRAGELPSAQPGGNAARMLPSSPWLRAVVLVIHGVLAAILVLVALWVLGIDAIRFWPFVIFVGTFCGVLAAYIAALSGYRVIAEHGPAIAQGARPQDERRERPTRTRLSP